MNVNDCINLENGKSYLLLMESTINNTSYFLAVGINKDEQPTQEYLVLQRIVENNEEYVKKIYKDPLKGYQELIQICTKK